MPCFGTARMVDGVITSLQRHGHPPDQLLEEKLIFKRELRSTVEHSNPAVSLRTIYNSIATLHPEAAEKIPFKEIRQSMWKWRKQQVFPEIQTLQMFADLLMDNIWQNRLSYGRGSMVVHTGQENGATSLLIYGIEFVREFMHPRVLYFDTSFPIKPQNQIDNILAIYAEYDKHVFPLVWIFLEQASMEAYKNVLQQLINEVPTLIPNKIVGCYNDELKEAARQVFPDTPYNGSISSYGEEIWNMFKENGNLVDGPNLQILKVIMNQLIGLSLMPPQDIVAGFEVVKENIPQQIRPSISAVLNKFERQWIIQQTPGNFSVYEDFDRITQNVERHHHILAHNLKLEPTMWDFQGKMMSLLCNGHADLQRIRENKQICRTPRIRHVVGIRSVKRLWSTQLEGNHIRDFVEIAGNLCEPLCTSLKFKESVFGVRNDVAIAEGLESDDDEGTNVKCLICRTANRTTVFHPCDQLVSCMQCYIRMEEVANVLPNLENDFNPQFRRMNCPWCRSAIENVFQVSLPRCQNQLKPLVKCWKCDNKRSIIYHPCNEAVVCEHCHLANEDHRCENCNQVVENTTRIFIPDV